jgi:hypothetical protein
MDAFFGEPTEMLKFSFIEKFVCQFIQNRKSTHVALEKLEGRRLLSVPNGPFGASAAATTTGVKVAWVDNSNNETGFIVDRSVNGGAYAQIGTVGANTTSYWDASTAAGTKYSYEVFAYDSTGDSSAAVTNAVTTPGAATATPAVVNAATTIPNGPYGLTATATGSSTTQLHWSRNSTNESGFYIQRETNGGSFATVGTVGTGVTSWGDAGLAAGTTYVYRVVAYNSAGLSGYSNTSTITTSGASAPTGGGTATSVPNAPFGLTAASISSTQNAVLWHDNSDNETGFHVERSVNGGAFSVVASLAANTVSYTDTSVSAGNTYSYRVQAYNSKGVSSYSNTATATSGTATTTSATSAPTWTAAQTTGYFTIGVYYQPIQSYGTWKSRGVNTVIDFPKTEADLKLYDQAAAANQLYQIRPPSTVSSDDVNNPWLLAYTQPEEPDIQGIPVSTLAANYAAWKAKNPKLPVLVNVSGANAEYELDSLTDSLYEQIFQQADWVSSDTYPVGVWGQPEWIDKAVTQTPNQWDLSTTPFNDGQAVKKIDTLSGGKQQFAYIETSYQGLSQANSATARQPTADEVRGETWDSIINGAKGVIYFPFTFPDTPDGTPASVAAGITSTDALITDFGSVLASRSNSNPNYLNLPGGLEATYVNYGGHTYYFVLNFSHTAVNNVTFSLPGVGNSKLNVTTEGRSVQASNGSITDSFTDYGVHIYEM